MDPTKSHVRLASEPFVIHCVNSYTYVGLSAPADYFELRPEIIGNIIHGTCRQLVASLKDAGIDYAQLGNALVPKPGRLKAAFIFDSTQAENEYAYGSSYAAKWIPALKAHGPTKTAVSSGDVVELRDEIVWKLFEDRLEGDPDFPRLPQNLYYAVYMTNLSPGQLRNMHEALTEACEGYLGHVDCSTWNMLKLGLHLPQVALRAGDTIITSMDDEGTANQPGYPFEENGFRVIGVADEQYNLLLSHRMDNGVPQWAAEDSSIALTALNGTRHPAATTHVVIDKRRIEYLRDNHGTSLEQALLEGLNEEDLAIAIKEKFTTGLIFNLRLKSGVRDGVPTPDLDALMYSVQVEFPTAAGDVKRYQVGLKYRADRHISEVVTFY